MDNQPYEPNYQKIPLDKMIVDRRAQQPFKLAWGTWLTDNFDPHRVGTLLVSKRPKGVYAVQDGQHRRYALMAHGYTEWWCEVREDLAIEQEAEGFIGYNTRKNVAYIDKFFARVTARETVALAIVTAVEEAGWKVSKAGHDGQVSAINALEYVYNRGADYTASCALVRDVLSVVTNAWGYSHEAVDGSILRGVGLVLSRYGDLVDVSTLASKLAKSGFGAARLLGNARSLSESYQSKVPNCVAELVVNVYNVRRPENSTRRLPDWRR